MNKIKEQQNKSLIFKNLYFWWLTASIVCIIFLLASPLSQFRNLINIADVAYITFVLLVLSMVLFSVAVVNSIAKYLGDKRKCFGIKKSVDESPKKRGFWYYLFFVFAVVLFVIILTFGLVISFAITY